MSYFRISKALSLADELIRIRLCNIQSNLNKVTIVGRFEDQNGRMLSHAHYHKPSNSDEIDLLHARSVGGSYLGVEPMGLIWSLSPVRDNGKMFLTYRDSAEKFTYHLQAFPGHINPNNSSDERALCEAEFQRTFLSDSVDRRSVNEDGIQGALFTPKNYRKCPGIIDLRGGTGGLQEFRAALLANKGFCVLQLAYFGLPGLADSFTELTDISYFEKGIDWLLKQECVHQSGVGILGLSRGAEMTLLLSALISEQKLRAACAISPLPYLSVPDIIYKDEVIPCHGYDFSDCVSTPKGYSYKNNYVDKIDVSKVYPIDRARVPLMLIYGGDDHLVAQQFYQMLSERMEQAGKSHLLTAIRYAGTGHMIEPPFLPAITNVDSWIFNRLVLLGGYPLEQSQAQLKAWLKIQSFFSRNLEPAELLPGW